MIITTAISIWRLIAVSGLFVLCIGGTRLRTVLTIGLSKVGYALRALPIPICYWWSSTSTVVSKQSDYLSCYSLCGCFLPTFGVRRCLAVVSERRCNRHRLSNLALGHIRSVLEKRLRSAPLSRWSGHLVVCISVLWWTAVGLLLRLGGRLVPSPRRRLLRKVTSLVLAWRGNGDPHTLTTRRLLLPRYAILGLVIGGDCIVGHRFVAWVIGALGWHLEHALVRRSLKVEMDTTLVLV